MQVGMIGLGRMGANMVRRLMSNSHSCLACDMTPGHSEFGGHAEKRDAR